MFLSSTTLKKFLNPFSDFEYQECVKEPLDVALILTAKDFKSYFDLPNTERPVLETLKEHHKHVVSKYIEKLEDICVQIQGVNDTLGPISTLIFTIHGAADGGAFAFLQDSDNGESIYTFYTLKDLSQLSCLKSLENANIFLEVCHSKFEKLEDDVPISILDTLTALIPKNSAAYGSEQLLYASTLWIQFSSTHEVLHVDVEATPIDSPGDSQYDNIETLFSHQPNFIQKCENNLGFFIMFEDACQLHGVAGPSNDWIKECYDEPDCLESMLPTLRTLPTIRKKAIEYGYAGHEHSTLSKLCAPDLMLHSDPSWIDEFNQIFDCDSNFPILPPSDQFDNGPVLRFINPSNTTNGADTEPSGFSTHEIVLGTIGLGILGFKMLKNMWYRPKN